MSRYAEIAYTPSVRKKQEQQGSARANAARLVNNPHRDELGPEEREFIAQRDGFYLATISQTRWPYIQFRGGPPGFLHVLDNQTLAFADVRGNRQYITTGNLDDSDRIALFIMDYAARRRLKLFGRASHHTTDDRPVLTNQLNDIRAGGHVERIILIHLEGFDWNCPKHITPRFTVHEIAPLINQLKSRIVELEKETMRLRER